MFAAQMEPFYLMIQISGTFLKAKGLLTRAALDISKWKKAETCTFVL